MATTQSTVVLVDLGEQGASIHSALVQLGIATHQVAQAQAESWFRDSAPRGVVTSTRSLETVVRALRALPLTFEVPVFVLADDVDATRSRVSRREVTAVVALDIDPGMLSLRLKTALQQAKATRNDRQATLMGFGAETKAAVTAARARATEAREAESREAMRQAMESALSRSEHPISVPSQRPPAPPQKKGTQRRAAQGAPASRGPADQAAPEALSAPAPLASSPDPFHSPPKNPGWGAVSPSAEAGVEPNVHTSAPPLPPMRRSNHSISEQLAAGDFSPPPNPIPLGLAALPLGSSPYLASADTGSAVMTLAGAMPETDVEELAPAATLPKTRLLRYGGAFAGVGLLAALVVVAVGGSSDEHAIEPSSSAVTGETPPPSAAVPPAASSASSATQAPGQGERAPNPDGPLPQARDGERERFQVANTRALKSCETLLGKPRAQFASNPKWQSSAAWKQARKNLMAGKQEAAHTLMCKAAFIDPSGPATSGLVKFYLSERALVQAKQLAEAGLADGTGSTRVLTELLGDVHSQMGEVKEARSLWLETMKLSAPDPKRLEPVVRNFIKSANSARRGGDLDLAERLLRRAAAFEPDNAMVAEAFASVLEKNGQPALAQVWARHALTLDADSKTAREVLSALPRQ